METETERLQGALAIVDSVIDRLEKSQFMIEETQKRDDEALKEAAHRVAEGLDEDDLEREKREEARIENLQYRDECRKEREEYWEPNEL